MRAAGNGLTTTNAVAIQPVDNVYVMVAVPAATPVTVPPLTLATPALLVLHVPPLVASLNEVVRPAHTDMVPVIAAGTGFTSTMVVAIQPVDNV